MTSKSLTPDPSMQSFSIGNGQFGFSGVGVAGLIGATEYTLVTICVDVSGSTSGFIRAMTDAVVEIVRACRQSPRADNLLIRVVAFNDKLREVHGFKLLSEISDGDYARAFFCGGMTALYDATGTSVDATVQYAESLRKQDFDVNAIAFLITDGGDNDSSYTQSQVKQAIAKARSSEMLESLLAILVGVNVKDPQLSSLLQDFKANAELDQYVELQDATAKTLARLAAFVSKSISSQSQALTSGGPSQTLTF